MVESYSINAYWGSRKTLLPECAVNAADLLRGLAQCDALFTRWYEKGRARSDALTSEVHANEQALKNILLKGQSRKDFGDGVIDELGFRLGLWNGAKRDEGASLSIHCGSYLTAQHLGSLNNCLISLPYSASATERLLKMEAIKKLFGVVKTSWSPDRIFLLSNSNSHILPCQENGIPLLGIMSYFPMPAAAFPSLPMPSYVEPVDVSGSVVYVTRERFDTENVAHVEAVKALTATLTEAGLLKPISL